MVPGCRPRLAAACHPLQVVVPVVDRAAAPVVAPVVAPAAVRVAVPVAARVVARVVARAAHPVDLQVAAEACLRLRYRVVVVPEVRADRQAVQEVRAVPGVTLAVSRVAAMTR